MYIDTYNILSCASALRKNNVKQEVKIQSKRNEGKEGGKNS